MPVSSVQLTGAGYPMEIHGKKYSARTLTDKDHAELDGYVQNELMRVARDSLLPDMTQEERREQLSVALLTVGGLSWSSGDGYRIMGSLKGMSRLGWQMIKHYHPQLSFGQFYEYVVSDKDAEGKRIPRIKEEIQKAIDSIDETFLVLNTSYSKDGEMDAESEEDSAEDSKSIE